MLKKQYCTKIIAFLDSELFLLEKWFSHPERFTKEQSYKSNLYLMPKSKDLGIVAMAEIVEGLFLTQKVLGTNGKPASRIQIARVFEQMFHFNFGDIDDKKSAIYNRKPFNLTKCLDYLRSLIEKENRKKNK